MTRLLRSALALLFLLPAFPEATYGASNSDVLTFFCPSDPPPIWWTLS